MAADDFALVVASETDWAWDIDAVVAAVAAAWPQAKLYDGYPIEGSTLRAYLDLPDPADGRGLQVALDDSGKLLSLKYGSPVATAEFVTWVLHRFPPPDDVTVQLFEWAPTPASPRTPPWTGSSPSDPDHRQDAYRSDRCAVPPSPIRQPTLPSSRADHGLASTRGCPKRIRGPMVQIAIAKLIRSASARCHW